jgi:MEMO1 family protein
MPYTFGALVPHSPLLIEDIAKENYPVFSPTLNAYNKIKEKIKDEKIEIIIIISSHGPLLINSFALGVALEYKTSLAEFGCFMEKKSFKCPINFSRDLLHFLYKNYPLKTINYQSLDYASSIPLELLLDTESKVQVVPILCSDNLDLKNHWQFGQAIGQFLETREEKVAIIASGDLSHKISKSSPAGYSPKGQKFDNRIIDYLNKNSSVIDNILKLEPEYIEEVEESALKPLSLMLGINKANYQAEKLAYQNDFGVGYLSFLFNK